jgi:hypothetical protein
MLSAKAALRELDLAPSGPSLYSLAGIMGGTGNDVAKDAAAGQAPLGFDGIRHIRRLVRQAIVVEEPSAPADISLSRDLAVGRHRGSPVPRPAVLPSITNLLYRQFRMFLVVLRPQLVMLYRRARQNRRFPW